MNITQVNHAILHGDFTNEQLDAILDAVKFRRSVIAQENKRNFTIGTRVKFTSNRNGQTYTGTVSKIKIKYILVTTPLGRYNVPANMLEAV
jgi:hypothetical protein